MQKILVVAPSWVGDCMLMQPMLLRLKQRFPDCRLDVLAPLWTVLLLRQMPEVDEVIVNPFSHGALDLFARYRLGKQLRSNQYDAAYVLPNSLKSALVPYFAKIPLRIGFIGEMRYGLLTDARKLNKAKLPLMVERFAQLAEVNGHDRSPHLNPLPQAREEANKSLREFQINGNEIQKSIPQPHLSVSDEARQQVLGKLELTLDKPVAIFCPGAEYGPAKRWPVQYYAELAQKLRAQGYAVWLIGSPKDSEVAEKIVALGNQPVRNLCGSTDLNDAIALLSCASLVVSNDSGLMHIAAALDRPMLAIFGSSSPKFTPPLSAKAQVLKIDLPCSPCFKRVCPLGHFNCMMQLTPSEVGKHVSRILEKQA